jgi:hypothetical protein
MSKANRDPCGSPLVSSTYGARAGVRQRKEVRIDLRFGRRDFAYKVTLSECGMTEMDMATRRHRALQFGHQQRHDGKNDEHHVIGSSRHTVPGSENCRTEMPRIRSTRPNSAASMRSSAMQPVPNRASVDEGTARRTTVQRAAATVTKSITGISINSADLVPTCGATNNVRTTPRAKPAPKTSAK